MKVCKSGTDEIADHLPVQVNRITKFIMVGGVSVTLKIIGKYHQGSHPKAFSQTQDKKG